MRPYLSSLEYTHYPLCLHFHPWASFFLVLSLQNEYQLENTLRNEDTPLPPDPPIARRVIVSKNICFFVNTFVEYFLTKPSISTEKRKYSGISIILFMRLFSLFSKEKLDIDTFEGWDKRMQQILDVKFILPFYV